MIKLLELHFENIGRFTTKQTIDFRNRSKLIQVDGKNNNTGGSSGAAKSTVFKALDYLLDINSVPATVLQSRLTKNPMCVEGVFEINGQEVIVTRHRKNGLSLKIGEESITGNVALAEERLGQLIDIPRELFGKMIHKNQKAGGFFLKMKASESYKFLIRVLGLESWTNKISVIEEDIKTHKQKIQAIENNIAILQGSLSSAQSLLNSLTPPAAVEDNTEKLQLLNINNQQLLEQISSINNQIQILNNDRNQINTTLPKLELPIYIEADITEHLAEKEQLLKIEEQIKQNKANAQRAIDSQKIDVNIKLNTLQNNLINVGYVQKELDSIKTQIINLTQEIAHLEQSTCPTCTQNWTGAGVVEKITQYKAKVGDLAQQGREKKQYIDQKEIWEAEVSGLKEMISSLDNASQQNNQTSTEQLAENQKKLMELNFTIQNIQSKSRGEYDKQVLEIKNNHQLLLSESQGKLLDISNKINEHQLVLNNINQNIAMNNGQIKQIEMKQQEAERNQIEFKNRTQLLNNEIELKNKELLSKQNELANIAQNILIAEESKRAIKNYTLQIFQESLDYIGEQASSIVSKIPNMASASIYFEGCKETKSGALKDEINAIVTMDGEDNIPVKSLSGGEETAIELAVDLAVIEMIEHKAGKGADFFILDEPFDGLDNISKEQCLELLQGLDTNKKIIIVDHSSELKAMVNDVITVVRNGEESFLNVV